MGNPLVPSQLLLPGTRNSRTSSSNPKEETIICVAVIFQQGVHLKSPAETRKGG